MKKINNFYQNNFDLIRVIAALMVLVTHSFELSGYLKNEPLYRITEGKFRFSTAGLYIFFFTSGFLVTKSLLTTPSILQFIWKRFLRIYPALLVIVLLTVFVVGPVFTTHSAKEYFTDGITWKYLFTTTGIYIRHILPGVFENPAHYDHGVNGSLWSIALELKLYFLLVIAGILLKSKIKYILHIITAMVTCGFILVLFNLFSLQNTFSLLHSSLFMIFWVGSMCCYYYNSIRLHFLILLTVFLAWTASMYFFEPARMFFELIFFSYLTLYFAYTRKTIRLKADLSYGVYIYAFLVTQIVIEILPGILPWELVLLVISAVIPLSFLSWILIEKQALKFKKKSVMHE